MCRGEPKAESCEVSDHHDPEGSGLRSICSALRKPFGNGTFHLRPVSPRLSKRLGSAVILLHYEPTPTLVNATEFQMLLRSTVKVMVLKDFYVLQKPDFRLICRTACAV